MTYSPGFENLAEGAAKSQIILQNWRILEMGLIFFFFSGTVGLVSFSDDPHGMGIYMKWVSRVNMAP